VRSATIIASPTAFRALDVAGVVDLERFFLTDRPEAEGGGDKIETAGAAESLYARGGARVA